MNLAWRIETGDVLEQLRRLPDGSVQTVVTSPPYWGLRDYGTGAWSGGDPACDHKRRSAAGVAKQIGSSTLEGDKETVGHAQEGYLLTCGRCGAARVDRQIGLERTPEEYVAKMVGVFSEVRRVLRDDGTLWLNLGDSYASTGGAAGGGHDGGLLADRPDTAGTRCRARVAGVGDLKPKDLVGIPWMVAFALRAAGWYLRMDIIWSKPNPMPESVTDRPTKAHEYLFLLSKSPTYFYDSVAIAEPASYGEHARNGTPDGAIEVPGQKRQQGFSKRRTEGGPGMRADKQRGHERPHTGFAERWDGMSFEEQRSGTRNRRSVWSVATHPFPEAHFATFPPKLIDPCVLAGSSEVGACPACGEPWERILGDATPTGERGSGNSQRRIADAARDFGRLNTHMGSSVPWEPTTTTTIGWSRNCACPHHAPVPCVVLDPFSGAGTTGLVATRAQRSYIGIELNPAYVAMSERRIEGDAPLFNRPAKERR